MMMRTLLLLIGAAIFVVSCRDPKPHPEDSMSPISYAGKVNAPDFPSGLEWLNTDHALSIKQLKGKVVLLDFWTFCCINCIHVFPELKQLEEKYREELIVIGVHSAKFTTEKGTQNIREAILRYGLDHPVVNDRDFQVWNSYAANAWPTFILIDPEGKVVGRHSGEGIFALFDEAIGGLVREFDAKGQIDRTPMRFALEKERAPRSLLAFPGKISSDAKGTRLFITDSNHNRVVVFSTTDFAVLDIIGSGQRGLQDGDFTAAEFNTPQGIAWHNDILYVADTENHAIRAVNLNDRIVTTLAGTGHQAREFNVNGRGTAVALNSPWDLLVHGDSLFVAMAGSHQIWTLDLTTLEASPYAGSGREDIIDGPLRQAAFAQPSGIATDGKRLYIADSEVSGIRWVDLSPSGQVGTIVGTGLFDFGDVDGVGPDVRLQHPIGLAMEDGVLYLADTYNNKIKKVDPLSRRVETLAGTGKTGLKDGEAASAELNEPNGLTIVHGKMYVADTNNDLIRIFDFATGTMSTLEPRDAEKLAVRMASAGSLAVDDTVRLPAQSVAPGEGTVAITVTFPEGYKVNTLAPYYFGLFAEDGGGNSIGSGERNIVGPSFPVEIPLTVPQATSTLRIDMVVYYCREGEEGLCMVRQVRVLVPLNVQTDAAHVVPLAVPLEALKR